MTLTAEALALMPELERARILARCSEGQHSHAWCDEIGKWPSGMSGDAESALLARLVEQGRSEGADLLTLRAVAEEASELGAARALERLGLADPTARTDLDELRELLSAWRDAKRTARDAVVAWIVRILLALVMLGMAVKLGLVPLVRQ